MMFRITDEQHTNAMINARQPRRAGPADHRRDRVPQPARLWDAYNVDQMYNAGVQCGTTGTRGSTTRRLMLLHGTGMSIFGSSNWTSPSSDSQREHNMFTTQPWMCDWLEAQFERKWTNGQRSFGDQAVRAAAAGPPGQQPAGQRATGVPTTGRLVLVLRRPLGAQLRHLFRHDAQSAAARGRQASRAEPVYTDYRYYALPALQPGTTYYWKIVSKTMAYIDRGGTGLEFPAPQARSAAQRATLRHAHGPGERRDFQRRGGDQLTATAGDSDGTIAQVEFFAGTTLIGTDTTSPYAVSWNNVADGHLQPDGAGDR